MKLNNGIRGIARYTQTIACVAVLLITLLASCQNSLIEGNKRDANTSSGTVTISLAGANGAARSIMPSAPSFSRYVLTLQKGTAIKTPDTDGLGAEGVTVELEPGEWSVTVDAYQELDHDGNAATPVKEYKAATATTTFTVEAGSNSIAVQLEPVVTDDAPQGVFVWDITLPAGVDSAAMSLETVSALSSLDLTQEANRSGSVEVDSGVHNLTILLSKDGLSTRRIENVHIYSGFQTVADLDLSGVIFGTEVLIAGALTVTNHGGPDSGYVVNAYAAEADANSEIDPIGTAVFAVEDTPVEYLLGIPVSAYKALQAGTDLGKKVYIRATHPDALSDSDDPTDQSFRITGNSVVTVDNLPVNGATGKNVSISVDSRTTLTAGPEVDVEGTDTTAAVTFTGAAGLNLTSADFAVSSGGTVTGVSVVSDIATVTVGFAANTSTTLTKTYTVSIAGTSGKITGDMTVAITQAISYKVTINLVTGGSIYASRTSGRPGTSITLSNTPDSDHAFRYYIVEGWAIQGNTFTLNDNVTVSAFFKPLTSYHVAIASAITGGSVSASTASGIEGAVVTLSNTPDPGYLFSHYTMKRKNMASLILGSAENIQGTTFTLYEEDVEVSAVFIQINAPDSIGTIGNPSVKLYLNSDPNPLTEAGSTSVGDAEPGTYAVSIAGGNYSQIIWYLNGRVYSEGVTATSISLSKQISGIYLLTVEATLMGSKKNTGSHSFVVEE